MKNIRFNTTLFILILAICLCQCPLKPSFYLSEESHRIHDKFWTSDSFLFGYLMENTKFQTPIFHFDSQKGGPTVLIIGGTHGNEPAGFEASHRLLKQFSTTRLKKGDIYVIPEANRIAALNNSRRVPVPQDVDRERGNLNRCYPGDPNGFPMEKTAYEITQLIRNKGVDLLLDLHESPVFHLEKRDDTTEYHGLGQTLIYTPNEEATWLGMVVLDTLNASIQKGVKQFSLAERPIKHSAAWSAGEHFNIPGFTLETCKKLPLEERIGYHIQIVTIILGEMGMI